MNNFFLYFVGTYLFTSGACLFIDIFIPELRNSKDSLDNIVGHYKYVSNRVFENLLIKVLPLYLFMELYYYGYESNRSMFVQYLQIILSLFLGHILHMHSIKLMQTNALQKYLTRDENIKYTFAWQTLYIHPVELYVVYLIPPILVPVIFGFNPDIINSIIAITNVLYILRNSNLVCSEYIREELEICTIDKLLNINMAPSKPQPFEIIEPENDNSIESENTEKISNTAKSQGDAEEEHHENTEEKQVNIEGENVTQHLHLD